MVTYVNVRYLMHALNFEPIVGVAQNVRSYCADCFALTLPGESDAARTNRGVFSDAKITRFKEWQHIASGNSKGGGGARAP